MKLDTKIVNAGGIYKKYASRLENLGIFTFSDFLYHIPSRYEDYHHIVKITEANLNEPVTIKGTILSAKNTYTRSRKTLQQLIVTDGSGTLEVTWFNQPYLTKTLKTNVDVALAGKIDRMGGKLIMQSPEYEVLSSPKMETIHTGRLVPIYPETRGISSKWLRRQVHQLLKGLSIEDLLPEEVKQKYNLPSLSTTLQTIHFPSDYDKIPPVRERLQFEELFFMHLVSLERKKLWREKSITQAFSVNQNKLQKVLASLPFTLTDSQQQALQQVLDDMQKDRPMNRLLQGDVGSGKTIVAALAMYITALNDKQAVLMAPTEILAEQHFRTISKILNPFAISTELVTGKIKPKNDDSHIYIGTHALLFSEQSKNAGLVVIDEQQRFGVEQRDLIRKKGDNPHVLTMTATPIPRTMALTVYGNLDLSYLDEVPTGRKRVKTWVVPQEKRENAYHWIQEQLLSTDSQAFILCPFIEQSESMQTVKAATVEYERLRQDVFPDLHLGLLHGKMKGKEKDAILQQFRNRDFHILVTTPVVEVGIDIPNATIMLIEASDRFGLSQLHQLRGRVGRGEKQSYCLLFTESKSIQTTQRLKAMETIYNGTKLAELDLQLRGAGDIFGTQQSGYKLLKFASFSDVDLIQRTRDAAKEITQHISDYPHLHTYVNQALNKNIAQN